MRVDEVLDELGQGALRRELLRERERLLGGRDLSCQEEPEHALGDDLLAAGCGREYFLTVRNGEPVEADALCGMSVMALLRGKLNVPRRGRARRLPRAWL